MLSSRFRNLGRSQPRLSLSVISSLLISFSSFSSSCPHPHLSQLLTSHRHHSSSPTVTQFEEDDFIWDLDEEESLASASRATSPPPTSTSFPPTSSLPPTLISTTPTRLPSTQPQIPSASSETPSSFARSKLLITQLDPSQSNVLL